MALVTEEAGWAIVVVDTVIGVDTDTVDADRALVTVPIRGALRFGGDAMVVDTLESLRTVVVEQAALCLNAATVQANLTLVAVVVGLAAAGCKDAMSVDTLSVWATVYRGFTEYREGVDTDTIDANIALGAP